MREILVSGSTAYDIHMHFDGDFGREYVVQGGNMSLESKKYEKNHGGTGANIAYNLALLGENPILLTAIGEDYSFAGIMEDKVNLNYIHKSSGLKSAHSVIISDTQDTRMTFFHPGATIESASSKISYIKEDIDIAIVSANYPQTMCEHMSDLSEKGIKTIADPSQQITSLTENELHQILSLSHFLIVNEHEFRELNEKLGLSEEEIISKFEWLIVTYGSKGLKLYKNESCIHIPAINIEEGNVVDTTGAGDALRAGILFSYIYGYDIELGCKIGTILASLCIQAPGSQYHYFNLGQVMEDMKSYFDIDIDLYQKRKY